MIRQPINKSILLITVILIILVTALGCTGNNPTAPKPPTATPTPVEPQPDAETPSEVVEKDIALFFPLKVGNRWEYEGEGNEFASYVQEVLFQKDNRFQLSTDTGGTVMANIFEVREDSIVNVYKIGEEYDHKNLLDSEDNLEVIYLKEPIQKGNKWISEENTYEITDTDATLTVPYGTFEDCVVVKVTFKDGSEIYMHYKDGIGMLQSEFISGDYRVFSRLKSFTSK